MESIQNLKISANPSKKDNSSIALKKMWDFRWLGGTLLLSAYLIIFYQIWQRGSMKMEQELFNKKIRCYIKLKYAGVIILLTELLVTFILVGVQVIIYAMGTEQAVRASGSLFALAFGLIAIALIIIIIYDRTAPWRKLSDSDIARNFIVFFGQRT